MSILDISLWIGSDSDEVYVPRAAHEYNLAGLRTLMGPEKELATQVVTNSKSETAVTGYSI